MEVVDRAAWLALRRLMGAGIVGLTGGEARVLHAAAEFADPADQRVAPATEWRNEADRAVRMAGVLAAGGFPEETPPLLARALRCVVAARSRAAGDAAADPATVNPAQLRALAVSGEAATELARVLAILRPGAASPTATDAVDLAQAAARLISSLWPGRTSPEALAARCMKAGAV